MPFFAVSVTFSSIPFGLTSEFLSFVCNHLLHFLIVAYKTLALYLCSHGFQNFFAFFPQGRAFRLRNRRDGIAGAAIGRPLLESAAFRGRAMHAPTGVLLLLPS